MSLLSCLASLQSRAANLGASWEGLAQTSLYGINPPDPHGAAGPNGIIQVVNIRVAYWNKTGQSLWNPVTLNSFFSVSPSRFLFDPRAVYDPITGHFYVLALEEDDATEQSYLHLAVSKTSNPASSGSADWYFYQINNTYNDGSGPYWGDYPGLGFDGQAIYVTVNLYPFGFGFSQQVQITVVDKAAALTGTSSSHSVLTDPMDGAFTLQPCTVLGNAGPSNKVYFAETVFYDSTHVRIWALQDPLGVSQLTSSYVQIPDNGGNAPYSGAPQAGTSMTIDTLDARTQGNAFWNNGAVWFCHTAGGSFNRSMVFYYKVDVSGFPGTGPSLAESGRVDGGTGIWNFQPSIGGNLQGDVCMVFCQSSATTYPMILYTTRGPSDTGFQPPSLLKASPGYCNSTRWGDYGSVSVDPTDSSFWITHEWAKTSEPENWSTWWGNVVMSVAPTIVVQPQPATQKVLAGTPVTYTVAASGTPPFGYQWRLNGYAIAGANGSAYSLSAAQPRDSGTYSVVVTNLVGSVTSSNVSLTVVPTVPLAFALNNTDFQWGTDLLTPWYGQTNVSHDGAAAGRSYFIGDGQQATLTVSTNGPGKLTFWWKVSSQTNADVLTFSAVGGGLTNTTRISGEVDWQPYSLYLPPGPQTLSWVYSKDAAGSFGLDAGFVDQVTFAPGGTAPFITAQPVGQAIVAATPVIFSVAADGTPVLGYQWRFNGVALPAATASTLALPLPGTAQAGTYSVLVSNAYGTSLSANAVLTVVPLVLKGDDSLGQAEASMLATNAVAIAAGSYHTLALLGNGKVLGWGQNYNGECTPPASLTNAVALAGGGYHSLALRADGTVVAWGDDSYGQATIPTGLNNVVAVAAGFWHSLALRSDGTVVAWGDDSYGQTSRPAGLNNVVAIAASGNHNLALRANGMVVAWGDNTDASGNWVGQSSVPYNLSGVQAIGAGDYHSLAVLTNGTVVAWGDNSEGQCQVPAGLSNAVAVTGGGTHSLALRADSSVLAWGNNWHGQCSFATNLFNVVSIAAGEAHSALAVGSPQPKLLRARHTANQFSVQLATYPGKNYALEYKTSLSGGTWTALPSVRGNGGLQTLIDSGANSAPRFYRVRLW